MNIQKSFTETGTGFMSHLFVLAYYSVCLSLFANYQRLEETVNIKKYSKCGTETEATCKKPLCKEGMYIFKYYSFVSKLKKNKQKQLQRMFQSLSAGNILILI